MLQRRRWRQSPRVMGRGAVLGWGCGQLAPLSLRGSCPAALPGRSAGAPASAHLNPAVPGALTLRGGGDQRIALFRRVSRDYLAGSLWPGCQGVNSESGAPDFPPGVAISLFLFHEGQRLQKHRDRETKNSDKPGCGYRQSAGKSQAGLGAEPLPVVPRRGLGRDKAVFWNPRGIKVATDGLRKESLDSAGKWLAVVKTCCPISCALSPTLVRVPNTPSPVLILPSWVVPFLRFKFYPTPFSLMLSTNQLDSRGWRLFCVNYFLRFQKLLPSPLMPSRSLYLAL